MASLQRYWKDLLLSRRQHRSIRARTTRLINSFFPTAIQTLNAPWTYPTFFLNEIWTHARFIERALLLLFIVFFNLHHLLLSNVYTLCDCMFMDVFFLCLMHLLETIYLSIYLSMAVKNTQSLLVEMTYDINTTFACGVAQDDFAVSTIWRNIRHTKEINQRQGVPEMNCISV